MTKNIDQSNEIKIEIEWIFDTKNLTKKNPNWKFFLLQIADEVDAMVFGG